MTLRFACIQTLMVSQLTVPHGIKWKNNRKDLEAVGQCIRPPRHVLPVSQYGYGSPPKFGHLFIGPLPTFPENFMQIHLEVFLPKVANRQTSTITYLSWRS